ncbi:hypothetical protein BpHYR1_014494, partial [Brachionus plicatilis]
SFGINLQITIWGYHIKFKIRPIIHFFININSNTSSCVSSTFMRQSIANRTIIELNFFLHYLTSRRIRWLKILVMPIYMQVEIGIFIVRMEVT